MTILTHLRKLHRCESLLVAGFILSIFEEGKMNTLFGQKTTLTSNTTTRFFYRMWSQKDRIKRINGNEKNINSLFDAVERSLLLSI